jgi:hypothetical protein
VFDSWMLYFGWVGSSWGHRAFFGSSWGKKVITPLNFVFKNTIPGEIDFGLAIH